MKLINKDELKDGDYIKFEYDDSPSILTFFPITS
jgi:hypothetical protein